MLLNLILLALSSSIDSVGIGIAYSIRKIKISKKASFILMIISLIISSIAILIGKYFHGILPLQFTKLIGGAILIIMGIILLLQAIKKPESYDIDNSKQIDSKEAITLGIALSLDSFSIGIGVGVLTQDIFLAFPILVAIFQITFLQLGRIIGVKLRKISKIPSYFWNIISSILLVIMGISSII